MIIFLILFSTGLAFLGMWSLRKSGAELVRCEILCRHAEQDRQAIARYYKSMQAYQQAAIDRVNGEPDWDISDLLGDENAE